MSKDVVCTYCEENAEHGVHYISGRSVCSIFCCDKHFNELGRNSDDFFRNSMHSVREEDRSNEDGEVQRVQES